MLGDYVTSDHWNNLTIFHNGSLVFVSLDDEVKVLEVPGEYYNMIIDPEIYIGGGPELQKKKGLQSHNNFAGRPNFAMSKNVLILIRYVSSKERKKAKKIWRKEFFFFFRKKKSGH